MKSRSDSADDRAPTRKSLIGRLKDLDDSKSWRDFFDTYWKLIYSFAIRSGCTENEAEEVVQETIISVSRKMPSFHYDPAVCSFKGWLMHVANWRVIDQLRKRRHGRLEPDSDDESSENAPLEDIPDPLEPQIERLWEEEWRRNLLEAAIERVKGRCNPTHYQMFYLAAVKRMPVPKIIQTLGVNRGQIYLAKHRVAGLVRKELQFLETRIL